MTTLARSEARGHFDAATRITLLEGDVDDHDREMAEFRAGQNKILMLLVGVLISLTTGAVLLALNLIVGGTR